MSRYLLALVQCTSDAQPCPVGQTNIRHWIALYNSLPPQQGPPEDTATDHAECGKLAADAVCRVNDLAVPDTATAMQIIHAMVPADLHGGAAFLASGNARDLVDKYMPGTTAYYQCWDASYRHIDNLRECSIDEENAHIVVTFPGDETEDDELILVRNSDDDKVYRLGGAGLRHIDGQENAIYAAAAAQGAKVFTVTTDSGGIAGIPGGSGAETVEQGEQHT